MQFVVVSQIEDLEIIAIGSAIREINRLRKVYGPARWRKMKGYARIRLESSELLQVELHWYEAQGFGRKEIKIKRFLWLLKKTWALFFV